MGRDAPSVLVDEDAVDRLEALVRRLPANGRVILLLRDGSRCDGMVTVRPSVQVFRDPQGREGINAQVQLERPETPAWHQRVWLDQVVQVEHLDSVMGSES